MDLVHDPTWNLSLMVTGFWASSLRMPVAPMAMMPSVSQTAAAMAGTPMDWRSDSREGVRLSGSRGEMRGMTGWDLAFLRCCRKASGVVWHAERVRTRRARRMESWCRMAGAPGVSESNEPLVRTPVAVMGNHSCMGVAQESMRRRSQ
jgi:hypothetical protein